MRSNTNKILWLCGIGHYLAHVYMLLFPSLALWIHTGLDLELGATLELGFWMYLLFGVLAPVMGWLGDRWSSRRMLSGMTAGIGLGSLVCAFSDSAATLAAGLATIGFFASIYHPVGMGLISRCCPNRGRALGNNGVWGSLGIGMGPLLAGVAGYLVGWRWTFALYGAATLLLGIWFWFWRIDETPLSNPSPRQDESPDPSGNRLFFALMLCCMTLFGFTYRATNVSLPAYFESAMAGVLDWLPGSTGLTGRKLGVTLLVSMIYLGSIPAQLLGGRIADAWDLRKGYLLFHALSLPFMVCIALLAEVPLFFAALGYAFFSIGMQPIENSLVAHLTPPHLRGLGYGMKFILTFGVGSLSVKMVQRLVDAGRTSDIYLVLAGIILVLLGFILLITYLSRKVRWTNA